MAYEGESSRISATDLRDLAEAWEAAGLSGPVQAVIVRHLDRIDGIAQEVAAHSDLVAAERARLVEAVAAGTMTVSDAIATEAAGLTDDTRTRAQALKDQATRSVVNAARRELANVGDVVLREHLRPAHVAIIDEARKLAASLGDVRTAEAAMASPPKAREAWVRLAELFAERKALLTILGRLRRVGIIPSPQPRVDERLMLFENPDAVPAVSRQNFGTRKPTSPSAAMAELVLSDARPVIRTAAEAAAAARGQRADDGPEAA